MIKKSVLLFCIILIIMFLPLVFAQESGFFEKMWMRIIGKTVDSEMQGPQSFGPSIKEQECMKSCASQGCNSGDMECMKKNSGKCMTQCNVKKPEQSAEEKCVEECSSKGCKEYDFECQSKNQEKCDKECGMIKAPDEGGMSEEQKCISQCVNAESPGTRCGGSQTGETGNELCQKCAKKCESLYAGPCLGGEKLEEKKKACETCEHCYGETVMGPSGEGWDCIVDVKCKDASSQFGDEPGTGPGVGQEGFVAKVFEGIGNFFKNIFGGNEDKAE